MGMKNTRSNLRFNSSFMVGVSVSVRIAARLVCVHSPDRFLREEQYYEKHQNHTRSPH
jgi:hypothetical protein